MHQALCAHFCVFLLVQVHSLPGGFCLLSWLEGAPSGTGPKPSGPSPGYLPCTRVPFPPISFSSSLFSSLAVLLMCPHEGQVSLACGTTLRVSAGASFLEEHPLLPVSGFTRSQSFMAHSSGPTHLPPDQLVGKEALKVS